MNFSPVTLTVNSVPVVFAPYDRGARGAFVYRKNGVQVNAPRLLVSSETNDAASDRYTIQINEPRTALPAEGCCPTDVKSLGTDLSKVDLRFLATTSDTDRAAQIDTLVAAMLEFKSLVTSRNKIYS